MIKGWHIIDKPAFKHDCLECKYRFTVVFSDEYSKGNIAPIIVDVYTSCGPRVEYLFRFSSNDSDYASGYNIEQILCLAAAFLIKER